MWVATIIFAGLNAGLFGGYYFRIRPRGLSPGGKRAVIGALIAFCFLAPAGFFAGAALPLNSLSDMIVAGFASLVLLGSVVLAAAVWFDTRSRGTVASIAVGAVLAILPVVMGWYGRGGWIGSVSVLLFPTIAWHGACWFGVWVYARPRWRLAAAALARRCRSCGYDMTGLGAGAVCPECGKARGDVR